MNEDLPLEVHYYLLRFLPTSDCESLSHVDHTNRVRVRDYYELRLNAIPRPVTLQSFLPHLNNFDPFLLASRHDQKLHAELCSLGKLQHYSLKPFEHYRLLGLMVSDPLMSALGINEKTIKSRRARMKLVTQYLEIQWATRSHQSQDIFTQHYQAFVALNPPAPILEKSKELLQNMSAGIKAKLTLFKDNETTAAVVLPQKNASKNCY